MTQHDRPDLESIPPGAVACDLCGGTGLAIGRYIGMACSVCKGAGHVPAPAEDTPPLPDCLNGHWKTPEGREMALRDVGKPRSYGNMTDTELANAIFMVGRDDLELIHLQTAAKERLRWLSGQLALANQRIAELATLKAQGQGGAVEAREAALALAVSELRLLAAERKDAVENCAILDAIDRVEALRTPTPTTGAPVPASTLQKMQIAPEPAGLIARVHGWIEDLEVAAREEIADDMDLGPRFQQQAADLRALLAALTPEKDNQDG